MRIRISCTNEKSFKFDDERAIDFIHALKLHDTNGLKQLGIESFGAIVSLVIDTMRISEFPQEIGYLSNLINFEIGGDRSNQYGEFWDYDADPIVVNEAALPPEAERFVHLRWLELAGTKISSLPPEIWHLDQLLVLNLNSSPISLLPSDIKALTHLARLSLAWTNISIIPPEIGHLDCLANLDLSGTEITELPPETARLENLGCIYLGYTGIKSVPEALSGLKNLRFIDLSGLELDKIPEWLALSGRSFIDERYPNSRRYLKDGYVNLYKTKLSDQPINFFFRGPEFLKAYFDKHADSMRVREGKVIFLGNGGAGKTHTAERLLNDCNDIESVPEETKGIIIKPWNIGEEDDKTKINIWDFGGQEIMHSMHRCFLTRNSLYVVVIRERDAKNPDDMTQTARYWLENIKSFAQGSPVILAINREKGGIEDRRNLGINQLNDLFPEMIVGCLDYCAKEDERDHFTDLRDFIKTQMDKLVDKGRKIRSDWMNVRNELEALGKRESGKKPYISQAEYHNLCRKYGVDENTRSELLQWFNDLGVCFSYHEENGEELKNYRVLDPEWLTNAIYAIIVNGVKGMSSEGIITKSEIRDILGNPDEHPNKMTKPIKYAKAEQGYVLDVMRMFRLCYKMNDREYFVPALCPVNRPEGFIPTEGSFKEHIGFGFKFGFLTNSVVHRLMIDCREKNFGMPLFYSNGIRLDFDDEKMTIVVDMGLNTDKLIIDIFSQERAAPIKDKLRWLREHILNICKKLGTEITKELFVLYQDGSKAELSLGSLYGLHNKHILKHYINGDEDIVECDVEALMELLHPREIIDRADDLFRSEDRRRTGTYKDVLQDAYSGATPPPSGAKRYKLAFSVAGEQRKLIGEVFKKLVDKGYGEDEVFFYGEDDTELAVSSGNIAATNLYLNKSERVVAVLSPEYIEKPNTANMEWRVVFSRLGPMHDGEVCLLKYGDFEYHEKLGLIRGADFTKQIKGMSADEIADWIIKWTKKHPIEKA